AMLRWLRHALCLLLTVVAAAYVVGRIDWKDSLLRDGRHVRGWVETEPGGMKILRGDDGGRHPLPGRDDPAEEVLFVPGLGTLFREMDLGLLALSLLSAPLVIVLMAVRWQVLLRTDGLDPGLREAVRLTWLGAFANNFLPGSCGTDLAK